MPEPIYWASNKTALARKIPAKKFDALSGQMVEVFDPDTGERIYEKIPQRGHVGGDYDNPVTGRPRWLHVLRHDGHVIRMTLTCAAADYDFAQLTSQERRAKARHFGWIPVGSCPLALIQAGELKQGQLIAKELRDLKSSAACAHGTYGEQRHCPHYQIEESARRALQERKQVASDKKMQPESDKLIAAQQEQTKDIVSGIAGIMADAVRGTKKP